MHLLLSVFNFLRINHERKGKKKIREPVPAVVRVPPWGQRDGRKGAQACECGWSREAGRGKDTDSPAEPPKGTDTAILASEAHAEPVTYKIIKQ